MIDLPSEVAIFKIWRWLNRQACGHTEALIKFTMTTHYRALRLKIQIEFRILHSIQRQPYDSWCNKHSRFTCKVLQMITEHTQVVKNIPCIQDVHSLGPSDTIWWQRSESTLAQVMAWCLTVPSPYLNECWLIISKVEWHSSKGEFTRDTSAINHWNYLEN